MPGTARCADIPAPTALLAALVGIVRAAGQAVLEVYASDFAVRTKDDASPVTVADERAEALIVAALAVLTPGLPVVAEEAAARGEAPAVTPDTAAFWLVDALDGTREFVSRNGEFTVNIGLVERGVPRLGVVHVPAQDCLYLGVVGDGAWCHTAAGRRTIRARALPAAGAMLACSRSHADEKALADWLRGRRIAGRLSAGSSLKFGLLASGRADWYPRFGRTMEWDTAAGHALLVAAGGEVEDLQGRPLRYGKPGHVNPDFVARGAIAP